MGDDWPDLRMLLPSTLACAPPNAHREVLSRVHWVTQAQAGHGAVREVCDLLLQARGDYAPLLNQVVL
jgi:3-deoxy-D-manno-octulosonate 8-phosphate phosphatase (KDO 8-P phosphatase)